MVPSKSINVSVIISAFNEAEGIADCVRSVLAHCDSNDEVLVVDGGFDSTGEIVMAIAQKHPNVRYIRSENDRGKGHGVRRGISEALGKIHVQFDADLQFMPEDIAMLADQVKSGACDVALGSRFTKQSRKDPDATFLRNFGNCFISLYASLLFGQRMTDVLAGIKAWSAEAAKVIDLQTDGFAYEIEIPARALQRGLRVKEYPIGTQARDSGESKVTIFGSGSAILRDMTGFKLKR